MGSVFLHIRVCMQEDILLALACTSEGLINYDLLLKCKNDHRMVIKKISSYCFQTTNFDRPKKVLLNNSCHAARNKNSASERISPHDSTSQIMWLLSLFA